MNKYEALYQFFSSFGLDAYPSTAVPEEATLPYLTYETPTSSWGMGEVSCTVKLWYHTASEAVPNNKAEEIANALGLSGKVLVCNEGLIWLKKGSPFCVSLTDTEDTSNKLRQINISIEYNTN